MKYIVLQVNQGGIVREMPIIFPVSLTHSVVAEAMIKGNPELRQARPIAAGFVSLFSSGIECHGESETLKLRSRGKQDDELLEFHDYSHGISLPPGIKIPRPPKKN